VFLVVATARPGHGLDELQNVIAEEVRRLAASGPTGRELERVVNGAEAQLLDGMQQVGGFGGIADQLNTYDYFAGTPDYFAQDLERYRQLTTADIQRVARQYLADPHQVVLSVVPQGKTELAVSEGRKP
jgi:zinc protease